MLETKKNNQMYCMRCKKKTHNSGERKVKKTKNNREMLQMKCKNCGCTKSQFI